MQGTPAAALRRLLEKAGMCDATHTCPLPPYCIADMRSWHLLWRWIQRLQEVLPWLLFKRWQQRMQSLVSCTTAGWSVAGTCPLFLPGYRLDTLACCVVRVPALVPVTSRLALLCLRLPSAARLAPMPPDTERSHAPAACLGTSAPHRRCGKRASVRLPALHSHLLPCALRRRPPLSQRPHLPPDAYTAVLPSPAARGTLPARRGCACALPGERVWLPTDTMHARVLSWLHMPVAQRADQFPAACCCWCSPAETYQDTTGQQGCKAW